MASSQDTTLQNLIINDVDSESTLEDMVENSQIQPNQLYATPDETDGFISLPIGTIFPSAIPQTSSAFHLLDGSTISKTGIYADFATLLQSLVTAGYNISCTQAQFDSDVSTYGQCGKFVIGTDTIRLPKITKFIEGLSNITNIGTSFQAGLPNITGSFANWGEGAASGIAYTTGAFYEISASHFGWGTTTGRDEDNGDVGIDASRSSSIYGNSNTVQPQSTAYPYYIVLANSYKTPVQVDIDEIASDLALKSDKNLVASVTLTTASNAVTISGLNIVADGGVYDIYVKGTTSNGSLQWLKMDDVNISQVAYGRNGTWATERQDGAIGLFSDYQSCAICTIYKPDNGYGMITYKSFSYNASQHEFATGSALYIGNGTSFTIYINGNKNFPIGSTIKIYKRS